MNYPSKKLVVPTELRMYHNGQIPKHLLAKLSFGGELWRGAAFALNIMLADAKKAGLHLTNNGDYRPHDRVVKLFLDRYSDKPTGRTPQVTRKYQGKTWYLKKGKSPSAAPSEQGPGKGGSPHGWGLAVDLAERRKGVKRSLSAPTIKWLCDNAPKYGFYLQGSDPKSPEFEIWHWQLADGDNPTPVVRDAAIALLAAQKPKKS